MKLFKMTLACAAFASAMLWLPETSVAQIRVHVRVGPPPRVVLVKQQSHHKGKVWVAGYWRWNGRRHVWHEGRYVAHRHGFVWVDGYWARDRQGWYWVEGYWRRC